MLRTYITPKIYKAIFSHNDTSLKFGSVLCF